MVLALALSVGAGITTAAVTSEAGVSTGAVLTAALSAGGTAAVLMIAALHALIRRE